MHLAQSPALDLADPLPGMTFVTLVRLTAESAKTIDEVWKRYEANEKLAHDAGGRVMPLMGCLASTTS